MKFLFLREERKNTKTKNQTLNQKLEKEKHIAQSHKLKPTLQVRKRIFEASTKKEGKGIQRRAKRRIKNKRTRLPDIGH